MGFGASARADCALKRESRGVTMIVLRDHYLNVMTFGPPMRPIFVELFGLLVGLDQEWRAQGATDDEISLAAFGFDRIKRYHVPANTGLLGGSETLVEETEEHVIAIDRYGRRTRLCKKSASIPHPLDYPVKDMDSWLKIKPRYVFSEERFGRDWAAAATRARQEGALIVVSIPGAFDEPRQLMGEENLCLAFYEQPELVHDILGAIADTASSVLDRVTRQVRVDVLSVHEDLAGKNGPLIGPAQVAEFVRPYFRRIWDMMRERGARVFQMDSDGNMEPVIPALLECGINSILPVEPAAGMDMVALRRKYGTRLAMMGGIDKHVLRRTKAEIQAELEYKMQPLMRNGGTVFGLDHRIPNGTPLENYRFYVRTAREILGLEPDPEQGWERAAF